MKLLKGQSVWITGASSGIGRELALIAAKAGASLVLISSNEERLAKVAQDCEKWGAELAHATPLDLSDSDSTILAVKKLLTEHGAPDFLILNAGKSQRSLAGETHISVMRKILDINFFGAAVIGHLVVEEMANKKRGHIAVTSSIVGRFGFPLRSSYAASKHALHGFFETMGLEYYSSGIRVSLVLLGKIKTDISLNALDAQGKPHGVMDAGHAKGMDQGICARKYWRAVLKGQPFVVIGGIETLMLAIHSYLPRLFRFIVRRVNPL